MIVGNASVANAAQVNFNIEISKNEARQIAERCGLTVTERRPIRDEVEAGFYIGYECERNDVDIDVTRLPVGVLRGYVDAVESIARDKTNDIQYTPPTNEARTLTGDEIAPIRATLARCFAELYLLSLHTTEYDELITTVQQHIDNLYNG